MMISVHRAVAVAATVVVLATAACGGDSPAPTAGSSPSAAPSPAPLTTPGTTTAASKINLTAADLPGYTASPPDETQDAATEAAEDAFTRCVGASTAEPVADFSSDDFTKGEQLPAVNVSSEVAFVADPAQVKQDLQAFASDKANDCIATFVQQAIGEGEEGLTFTAPEVSRLTPTAQGVDGAFGFRVVLEAQAEGQTIPFTFDLLAYGKARTEVTLLVLGVGTSVPEAERDALFAKLVERGTANAL